MAAPPDPRAAITLERARRWARRPQRRVEKPWGSETIFAETEKFAGKILAIRAGQRLSLQRHAQKHEVLHVLHGTLRLSVGEAPDALQDLVLGPGDGVDLPPGTVHRLEAIVDSEVVEVSSPELDDLERLADDYGRMLGPGATP